METLCCFAASKTGAASRIFAQRAPQTELMDGESIPNQR